MSDVQDSIDRMNKLGGIYSDLSSSMTAPVESTTTKTPTTTDSTQGVSSPTPKSQPSSPTAKATNDILGLINAVPDAASSAAGAYVGSKVANAFPDYVPPENALTPTQLAAQKARDEWLQHQSSLTGGMKEYELKADALKRQADDLRQIHAMESFELEKARNAWIENKIKASEPPQGRAIITPDLHTRQIQGTGGEPIDDIGTGRGRGTSYQAKTQEIAEHGAEGKLGLKELQSQGLVKPGGITLQYPGITASSPMGVLVPAPMQSEFDIASQKILESTIPQEQKMAMLKDLYKQQLSTTSSANTAAFSAEKDLLKHTNLKEAILSPLEHAVEAGKEKFSSLGGEAAAAVNEAIGSPTAAFLSKARHLIAPLSGALAGHDIYKGYEAQQKGDTSGAVSNYASGLGGALMMIPTPATVGAGATITAAGMGKDMYDYYMSLPPDKQKELNEQMAVSSQAY